MTNKKRKNQKKVSAKPSKKSLGKEERQLYWFIAIIAIVFIGFIAGYLYIQSLKTFEYGGVKFVKEDHNGLEFYHGRFPIIYFGELKSFYNFYLRTDPRENNILINSDILVNRNIILSLDPDVGSCSEATIAQMELGKFLGAFQRFNVNSAVNDEEVAEAMELKYATCDNAEANTTVFIVQKSDSPSIGQIQEDCYEINVGECENLKTIERLIVGVMAQINEKDL